MSETWRAVPGYEGKYEVSDQGTVRALERMTLTAGGYSRRSKGCVLKPHVLRNGYLQVDLQSNGLQRHALVHALVLSAFVGPRPVGLDIAHGNGNKQDNRLENLRYATRTENALDKYKHGTCALARLTPAQVLEIDALLTQGQSYEETAETYSVSVWAVKGIAYGKRWAWLTGRRPKRARSAA